MENEEDNKSREIMENQGNESIKSLRCGKEDKRRIIFEISLYIQKCVTRLKVLRQNLSARVFL